MLTPSKPAQSMLSLRSRIETGACPWGSSQPQQQQEDQACIVLLVCTCLKQLSTKLKVLCVAASVHSPWVQPAQLQPAGTTTVTSGSIRSAQQSLCTPILQAFPEFQDLWPVCAKRRMNKIGHFHDHRSACRQICLHPSPMRLRTAPETHLNQSLHHSHSILMFA